MAEEPTDATLPEIFKSSTVFGMLIFVLSTPAVTTSEWIESVETLACLHPMMPAAESNSITQSFSKENR